MTDEQIVTLLIRNTYGDGTGRHLRIDRAAVGSDAGTERLHEIDAWVANHGGSLQRVLALSQGKRLGTLVQQLPPGRQTFEYYLVPRDELLP